jgi:Leucine-rich repeat (LRR) protein
MKAIKLFGITCSLIAVCLIPCQAQELANNLPMGELESHKQKVRDLVDFLQFAMNTIGDSGTPTRDKNVVINQSYLKLFEHSKVQIEDDLNEDRNMVTRKDVQAYLSDIDFFFKHVEFTFNVEDISHYVNANDDLYFVVSMTRNLKGVTIENDSVNTMMIRYLEINFNEKEGDLKIASIYSNRVSLEEELKNWWWNLPYPWVDIFSDQLGKVDSVDGNYLLRLMDLEKIDLSVYPRLRNVEPLSKLTSLKRVNLSGTQINDIVPLKNLTNLEVLDCMDTEISDLSPLKYALGLKALRIDSTKVTDIEVLGGMENLRQLSASYTFISSLEALSGAKEMRKMNLSKTRIRSLKGLESMNKLEVLILEDNRIKDLSPIRGLKSLNHLQLDNTLITSLDQLSELDNLRVLSCNNTLITSLMPLGVLPNLETVYSDNTLMVSSDAKEFITQHPHILVVYGTESLRGWWSNLSKPWKIVLMKEAELSRINPSREEMARVANITRINVSGIEGINSLEPVKILKNLKELRFASTNVNSLAPLRGLLELEFVDASNTMVNELYSLEKLPKLTRLGIDNTQIKEQEITRFINNHPSCLVMYKSDELLRWYSLLSKEWRTILMSHVERGSMSDSELLHSFTKVERLTFDAPVNTLEPVQQLTELKELEFNGTMINSLEPLRNMGALETLRCSHSPIASLGPLTTLRKLKKLNFEDTLVEDLTPLTGMLGLTDLNFAGTPVKDLKPLKGLLNLRSLECQNTDVKNLKPIQGLRGLRSLKCYNTRINIRDIESFKKSVPQCEVIFY